MKDKIRGSGVRAQGSEDHSPADTCPLTPDPSLLSIGGSAIRVGAVNYLNTKPLIYDLQELAPQVELMLDVPSRLADLLRDGSLDVALIPVIEYFRAGCYTIVPDVAIVSRGPVLSVTLFSKVPWPEIGCVALDAGSRTSAALAQVLLQKRYGLCPEVINLPLELPAEDAAADATCRWSPGWRWNSSCNSGRESRILLNS